MSIIEKIKRLMPQARRLLDLEQQVVEQKFLTAQLLIRQNQERLPQNIQEAEFKVFSQWGDDGIIQYLIGILPIQQKVFVEFGVQDYREANTRFLLMHKNWQGLIMDGSQEFIQKIRKENIYYLYDLQAQCSFITTQNINQNIKNAGFEGEIGLLHIDIDGNDYWIWEKLEVVKPTIVIVEYNGNFGKERPITIPYQEDFVRQKAHYSYLYFGASLAAFAHLAEQKGYVLVGCNSNGNNAYFVRKDRLCQPLKALSVQEAFVGVLAKESRDKNGKLDYLNATQRQNVLKGLPVWNVVSQKMEEF